MIYADEAIRRGKKLAADAAQPTPPDLYIGYFGTGDAADASTGGLKKSATPDPEHCLTKTAGKAPRYLD